MRWEACVHVNSLTQDRNIAEKSPWLTFNPSLGEVPSLTFKLKEKKSSP